MPDHDMMETMEKEAAAASVAPVVMDMESLAAMGQEYILLRTQVDALEAELSELKKRMEQLRKEEIPDAMQRAGMVGPDGKGSFTLATGELLFLQQDMYVSYKKADEERMFQWLRSRGDEALIKPTVHPGTFKAYIKDLMSKGENIPEFVNQYAFSKVGVRGTSSKGA